MSEEQIVYPRAFTIDIAACHFDCCSTPVTPEQIHIATGSDPTMMMVTWTTLLASPTPVVQYGTVAGEFTTIVNATSYNFTVGGWLGNVWVDWVS